MADNAEAVAVIAKDRGSLLSGVKPEKLGDANGLVDDLEESLQRLLVAVNGRDAEKTSIRVAQALKDIADIEILEAPGLPFIVNKSYNSLPRLEGRAVVELEVAKADSSAAFVDLDKGVKKNTAIVSITVDGYSAPISAGKFLCNVKDGNYNQTELFANFQSAVIGSRSDSTVPLEILPAGEFEPMYRLPLDIQGGELPVLPLSISGAVAFMHVDGTESDVDSNRFFVYKFDKTQAGLAGLSFDEGTFGVFGYVTNGLDILSRLEKGDIIKSARIVSGEERLIFPKAE